ncbi:hypothetical protein HK100_004026, partial [Physocladia obscura]
MKTTASSSHHHLVKFNLSASLHIAPKIREPVIAISKQKSNSKGKPNIVATKKPVPQTNYDERRSFQLGYSISTAILDGKSPVFLQPEISVSGTFGLARTASATLLGAQPVTWSAAHEIDITNDTVITLLSQQQIEISVFEIVKVEVEKKSYGLTREILEANGLDRAFLDPTVSDFGFAGKVQKQKLKALKQSLNAATSEPTLFQKENRESLEDKVSSKETSKTASKMVKTLKVNADDSLRPESHASSYQTSDSTTAAASSNIHELPHPHHYDHPEKHIRNALSRATSASMSRSRSAQSLAALAILRPKTPPSPHHCESVLTTLMHNQRKDGNRPVHMPLPQDISGMHHARRFSNPSRFGNLTQTGKSRRPSSAGMSTISQVSATNNAGLEIVAVSSTPQLLPGSTDHQEQQQKIDDSKSVALKGVKKKTRTSSPKKRYILETRKITVGKIFIDLTNLFSGDCVVHGTLQRPIDGLTSITATLTLDTPLLSQPQLQTLNPLIISIICVQNLPSTPTSYTDLDAKCLPITLTFQFYNDSRVHEVCINKPHARTAVFDTKHVILTGLLDQSELARKAVSAPHEKFEVRVYDRIPKLLHDCADAVEEEKIGMLPDRMGPHGIASFDLSEFLRSAAERKICRMRVPVLPAPHRYRQFPGANQYIPPPALWVEHGTSVVIECQMFAPLIDESFGQAAQEEKAFGRIVVFSGQGNSYLHDEIDSLLSSRYEKTHPEIKDNNLHCDYISGFILSTPTERIHILEGLKAGTIISNLKSILKNYGNSAKDSTYFEFDPNASFAERIWDTTADTFDSDDSIKVVKCNIESSIQDLVRLPRIYIADAIPERAYNCLMWLNKIKCGDFLVQNSTNTLPWYPNRKAILSFTATFGKIAKDRIDNNIIKLEKTISSEHQQSHTISKNISP